MSARGIVRVDLHRAQDLSRAPLKSELVPIATIQIHEPFPEVAAIDEPLNSYVTKARAAFDDEAAKLFQALIATLPGGTIDALLVRLLDHKRSLFGVTHAQIGMAGAGTLSDAAYAALGAMVKALALEMESRPSAGVVDFITKAIDTISPTVGAEVRAHGPEDTYAKRW